jgi:thioesterase domain-containing protein
MARVRDSFAVELPLRALFQAPRLIELAEYIEQARTGGQAAYEPLVTLQVGHSDAPPLFCIHPVGGNAHCYMGLANRLDAGQIVLGLEAVGLSGKQRPLTSFDHMARLYTEHVQAACPNGPYMLIGWSLGGIIAFEMAKLLQSAGKQVGLLALIDANPAPPEGNQLEDGDPHEWMDFIRNVLRLELDELADRRHRIWQLGTEEKLSLLQSLVDPRGSESGGTNWIKACFTVYSANQEAWRRYVPSTFDGKIVLFEAEQRDVMLPPFADGWNALAGRGCDVIPVKGDHLSVVRDPGVSQIAQVVQRIIKDATNR